ncbi:MAG: hypothetical protein K2X03_07155 [Bryobacteraceae bacterium]|nr:hypothetical protein [Bryobacteraceae bacterium]
MERNRQSPSLWKTARVETLTLAVLAMGWMISGLAGWVPDVNSSLVAVGVYAAWIGLCVIVYRYFYKLD